MKDSLPICGCFLVKATGNILENDGTYIEVIISNKKVFAKPSMPFGWFFVPNSKWFEKHKDEIGVWIMYENGNPSYPVWIGIYPLDNKTPGGNYPYTATFKTENFKVVFDDEDKKLVITSGEFEIILNDSLKSFEVKRSGDTVISIDDKINLYSGKEKAVLGDTLKNFMNSFFDVIIAAKTIDGKTLSVDTITQITNLKVQADTFLSTKINLE
jgi:hypothetical protein